MKEKNNKILLHACCAICSGYPILYLKELGYEPIVYFFNPNIYPKGEYYKRLDAQVELCKVLECELIIGEYEPDLYNQAMIGFEDYKEGSERCKKCFELRLSKTVQETQRLGIPNYTTSLAISPHKNLAVIKEVGESFSDSFDVKFIDIDFRKKDGFLKTTQIAKDLDLYRQGYCGCEMSMRREE